MHASKSGMQKTRQIWWWKFGEESEYYLDLENEDKKWYKEKSTLSNGELLSDPNVSISLLLICL